MNFRRKGTASEMIDGKLTRHVAAQLVWLLVVSGSVWAADVAVDGTDESASLVVLPSQTESGPTRRMLGRYLMRLADEHFQRRQDRYERRTTREEALAYQEQIRAAFIQHLGGFPDRTPLNAKSVGTVDGDGYSVEKLIYESQPRHYVTAVLFLPKTDPPFPAVLVPCGHSSNGKAAQQRVCILLAKHGIAAMSYDPIGQAERVQMLDADGKPRFGMTHEHSLVGTGCIPLGRGTATYRIWDGIRSIDYLADRPEIDARRIGVTGCSGGGTLTSYLMTLDERVACAAPSCYVTSFRRLLDTIGPQDAEQNIHGQLAFEMDHADYLMVRAPKPTLILASTHDFFDIDGTWDSFRQAKRFYTRLGFAERISLIEADAKHGYPKLHREAMVRWMRRWLSGIDEPVTELEFEIHSDDELQCTPRGQVMLMDGARSVVDLNVELNEQLAAKRREHWASNEIHSTRDEVRRISGIRKLTDVPRPAVHEVGKLKRSGYQIRKLIMQRDETIQLPALLFEPARPSGQRILYIHDEGKGADAGVGGTMDSLASDGHTVLAIDVRGYGETGSSNGNQWGGNWNDLLLSYLIGRSMVGMRCEDVLCAARYLSESNDRDHPVKIRLVAVGQAGPTAVHAVALEPQLFESLSVSGSMATWSDVVRDPTLKGQLANTVHGALHVYDLDDLIDSFPDSVTLHRLSTRVTE